MYIYSYNMGSASVAALKQALGAKLIRLENSNFIGSADKQVLNWGSSTPNLEVSKCQVLNRPEAIEPASNKLRFFEKVKDLIQIPSYTTQFQEAFSWMEKGKVVVVREKLTGHSAEGLVILENRTEWDNYDHSRARMYILYIPKQSEWRIHVFRGEVIHVQKKGIREGTRPVTFRVQNHNNGFIYLINDVKPPQDVITQAVKALEATELDFGAVDVIYNTYRDKAFVLEINTAPGLEGSTINKYATAIGKCFNTTVKEMPVSMDMGVEAGDLPQEPAFNTAPIGDLIQRIRDEPPRAPRPLDLARVEPMIRWYRDTQGT